ncbi:hypothetical protein FIBSPDRAFT_880439 [Athelia psychrophila]|uniref:Uncharacterized protein n=1 Tax=Athelia psychrophila TaxID=1759441 RepID=A0A167SW59_9AGAM|nr:hypothetical protein FIBSPDRAFT_880439 [Fibularhizoctonia sp. CBS 109695]
MSPSNRRVPSKRGQSNRWQFLQVFRMKAAGHIDPRANALPMWAYLCEYN